MQRYFTLEQKRKVKKLIVQKCANYQDNNCIALDYYDGCPCIQIINNKLYCNYFRNAVLPNDSYLEKELTGYSDKERCAICKKPFDKTGNRKIYCAECAKRRKKFQQAEYARKRYLKYSKNRG